MAMRLGTENKRQVYLVIALFAVIVLVGGFELYQTLSGPAATTSPAQINSPTAASGTAAPAKEAQRISFASLDPVLHFDKLAQSENVDYKGTGRNIFSAESAPPPIPKAIAAARPGPAVNVPPPVPQPPPIDLKYFGYSEVKGGQPQAYFIHGDDVFIAKSGEIVDHRYKVDTVNPKSADVTDLGYNHTQTLPMATN
ncbi:MAG TPA: hypothetical protein VJ732_17110 [Bryobacteraceae bacterium]|nr:hypothetical protein [Bryobacteraceae bacterium]